MFINVAHQIGWDLTNPQIMGIINVNEDSFYERSRQKSMQGVLSKVNQMVLEGAHLIDIGAQSTRPGSELMNAEDELTRLIPYIIAIKKEFPKQLISVDTFNAKVAEVAINNGAHIINDISGARFDESILEVVSKYNAGYIAMHMTGNFSTMHQVEPRQDIIETIMQEMLIRQNIFAKYGITKWVMDPGFGFGKTIQENFTLIKSLQAFKMLELPILIGVSRKSSIYKTLSISPDEALNGTTVLNTVALINGASILRVHDVKQANEIIQLYSFLK